MPSLSPAKHTRNGSLSTASGSTDPLKVVKFKLPGKSQMFGAVIDGLVGAKRRTTMPVEMSDRNGLWAGAAVRKHLRRRSTQCTKATLPHTHAFLHADAVLCCRSSAKVLQIFIDNPLMAVFPIFLYCCLYFLFALARTTSAITLPGH
jgi:hypothetical protein